MNLRGIRRSTGSNASPERRTFSPAIDGDAALVDPAAVETQALLTDLCSVRARAACASSMDRVEFRQQDDAFLLVGIGARNHRDAGLGRARVVGKMRHVGRNIDEVAGARNQDEIRAGRRSTSRPRRSARRSRSRALRACAPWRDRQEGSSAIAYEWPTTGHSRRKPPGHRKSPACRQRARPRVRLGKRRQDLSSLTFSNSHHGRARKPFCRVAGGVGSSIGENRPAGKDGRRRAAPIAGTPDRNSSRTNEGPRPGRSPSLRSGIDEMSATPASPPSWKRRSRRRRCYPRFPRQARMDGRLPCPAGQTIPAL